MRGLNKIMDVKHLAQYIAHFIVSKYLLLNDKHFSVFWNYCHNYNCYWLLLKRCSRKALVGVLFSGWCGRICQLFDKIGFLFFLSTQLHDFSQTPLQLDVPCSWVLAGECEQKPCLLLPMLNPSRSLSFGLSEMATLHLSSVALEIIFFKWQRHHLITSYRLHRTEPFPDSRQPHVGLLLKEKYVYIVFVWLFTLFAL